MDTGTQPPRAPEKTTASVYLAGVAVIFLAHAAWLACIAEDAFISFRFSRHLAAGHGLVWNLGEPPVEGFTNLLWVLLGAMVELVGLDLPRTLQILGIVAGLATLWLCDRFAAHLDLGGWARRVPSLLLAVSGPFATWSASGLETSLFTLLALGSLYALARWTSHGARSALATGWLLAALATLTRPEGGLLAVAAAALSLSRRDSRRAAWMGIIGYGAFLAGLTVFRLLYFGVPLPMTFYAKTGGGLEQVLRGATYTGFFAFHFLLPLLPLAIAGLGRRAAGTPRRVVIILAGWSLAFGVYVVAVGGDYMAMDRFFVPVLPAIYLLVGVAARGLWHPAPARWVGACLLALCAAGTLVHSTPLETKLYAKPPLQHGTWRGVETERWHVARLELLARFFAERAAGRTDASLATSAIGVLGWRTGLAIYDFHGLVDPEIARLDRAEKPLGAGLAGHEKEDPGHVLDRRPTWWMYTRRLRDERAGWPDYDPEIEERLRREYRRVSVWLEDRENQEQGYFTFLERREEASSAENADEP